VEVKKMNLRLRAYDLILKTLVAVATTLIVSQASAATEGSDVIEDYRTPANDIVEKYIPIDVDTPYKQHRKTHGFMFEMGVENVQMFNYVSIIDFTTPYLDMFGDSEIPLYNVNLSYKYNFSLGSLAVNAGMGEGTYTSYYSGDYHSLTLTKYTLSTSYIMDAVFNEPYAAPYLTFGVNQFTIDEKDATQEFSTGIEAAYFFTAGILFQLNWLDQVVSRKALVDYGLENTYFDLYVTQYQPSLDPVDPNTETEYTLGMGLRLEF
jgi:hypothetical protein